MFTLVRGPARGRGASRAGSAPRTAATVRRHRRGRQRVTGTGGLATGTEVRTGSMSGPADIVLQGIENRVLYRMILLCHFKELEP